MKGQKIFINMGGIKDVFSTLTVHILESMHHEEPMFLGLCRVINFNVLIYNVFTDMA
jgi:hypothetical protein